MDGIDAATLSWIALAVVRGASAHMVNKDVNPTAQYDLTLLTNGKNDTKLRIECSIFFSSTKSWCEIRVLWGESRVLMVDPSPEFYYHNKLRIAGAYSKALHRMPSEVWLIKRENEAIRI